MGDARDKKGKKETQVWGVDDMYRKRNAIKAYMIKHIEYVCMCLRQNGSQWDVSLGKVR